MDRPTGGASRSRQPHKRLCALQTGSDGGQANHQAIRRRPLGRALRLADDADRSVIDAAGIPAHALDAAARFARRSRLETNLPSSRTRADESGKTAGALRLAWPSSRSSHHFSARKKRLGEKALVEKLKMRRGRGPLRHAQFPQQITARLAQHSQHAQGDSARLGIGSWRNVHRTNPLMLQQLPDAKYVIGIADGHATVQAVGAHDDRDAHRRFRRIAALHFRDQLALRNSATNQIIASHSTFAELHVSPSASGRDDHRRRAAFKQIVRMVEPRTQNRRRMSRVFRGTEDNNRIGWMNFLKPGRMHDSNAGNCQKRAQREHRQQRKPQEPEAARPANGKIVAHPWAKKREISSAGMAPSRMTFQRADSCVRSMMVEATSRGEAPPSTMMLILSCNWVRT